MRLPAAGSGTVRGVPKSPPRVADAGFTLVEVLAACLLFAAVSFAGLDALRALGTAARTAAARHAAAAAEDAAVERMRADARGPVAVWAAGAACGPVLGLLVRDAGGLSFRWYARRDRALVRVLAPGPLDPCDPSNAAQTLIADTAGFGAAALPASEFANHEDPASGVPDGTFLAPRAIADVAADVHVRDLSGAPLRAGNGVVEVTVDADPALAVVDLAPENRPSGFTTVLTYACGARCAANVPFPEARGRSLDGCMQTIDFADDALHYVPAAFAYQPQSDGSTRIVVTAYLVTGAFVFALRGADAVVVRRAWSPALWPPGGVPLADPYPVDYAANAVHARGAQGLAADTGANAAFAGELGACAATGPDGGFDG